MRLEDKVAIVTGAAHGMGEAEARLFARATRRAIPKNLSCSRDGTCVSLASEQLLSDLINPQGWCSSRRW
jgi:NAD(P)-dependent dehydrogenase (short-subunit alcohol dehydrogenase family)